MKVNIIFLDFDGVLLNRNSWRAGSASHAKADPICIGHLNRIIEETGAQVVVTSTMRKRGGRIGMCDLLYPWGLNGTVRDVTPVLPLEKNGKSPERGAEIQKWIFDFTEEDREPLGTFVILDDDCDMGGLTHRLVRTSGEIGLTEQDADRAIAMLMEGIN